MIKFRVWDKINNYMDEEDVDVFVRGDGKIYLRAEDSYDTPHTETELADKGIVVMVKTEDVDKEGKSIWVDDFVYANYYRNDEFICGETIHVDSMKTIRRLDKIVNKNNYDRVEITLAGNLYEQPDLYDEVYR